VVSWYKHTWLHIYVHTGCTWQLLSVKKYAAKIFCVMAYCECFIILLIQYLVKQTAAVLLLHEIMLCVCRLWFDTCSKTYMPQKEFEMDNYKTRIYGALMNETHCTKFTHPVYRVLKLQFFIVTNSVIRMFHTLTLSLIDKFVNCDVSCYENPRVLTTALFVYH
jgi:hypothetical protein